ncbi:MAG: hypothetical protein NTW16_11990 [Bacteroidetes bacterium]|nr:hypothetical protein [Bacteroidota bacterium]
MNQSTCFTSVSLAKLATIASFVLGFITIWIHLEIRIAEINVEIFNLKQNLLQYKSDNRQDMEIMRSENTSNTRVILNKVDEIQIYLRNSRK